MLGFDLDTVFIIDIVKTGAVQIRFDFEEKPRQDPLLFLVESFKRNFFGLAHRLLNGTGWPALLLRLRKHTPGVRLPAIIAFQESPDSSVG